MISFIRIILKFLFVILLLSISACSSLPNSKIAQTEYGEFTYYLSGDRKPTVIFESGLGDDMTTWKPVIAQIETISEVFTYNRAGFSGSHSHNSKRNGAIIVKELKALLESAGVTAPYILVGHSLGGGYMELFAKTFPDEVAGVVLVDPNSSKYPERCKAQKLDFCDPPSDIPSWASMFLPSAVEGEIKGFAKTHSQVNAINNFPNVPLVVLSATKNSTAQSSKVSELYTQMHRELAEMSFNSKFIICDTCTHYIHKDEPSLVVEAIQWVKEQQQNQ